MSVKATYGNGGWVRIDSHDYPGPVYLRFALGGDRPRVTELYVDGRGEELHSGLFRNLDLAGLTSWVTHGDYEQWLSSLAETPGPDLSTLASYFSTSYGKPGIDWVGDSLWAQVRGSGVKKVNRRPDPRGLDPKEPAPVASPEHGLTDEFLRTVADNYAWAAVTRRRYAPMIAAQAGVSERTVHGWVAKARKRGIIAPTTPGKVG